MTKAPNEHDGKAEPMTFIARPPVRDGDTFAVLDDALLALAERKGLWLCDDLAFIHLLASLIGQAERWLPDAVLGARDNGAGWHDIATVLATSPDQAQLRFDPDLAEPRRPWGHPGDTDGLDSAGRATGVLDTVGV